MMQLIRVNHLAGRCTGCGECERACPVGIPLMLLMEEQNRAIEEMFGYRAGTDPEAKPPLLTFDIKGDDVGRKGRSMKFITREEDTGICWKRWRRLQWSGRRVSSRARAALSCSSAGDAGTRSISNIFRSLSAKDVVLPRTEKLFGFSYAFGAAPGQPFGRDWRHQAQRRTAGLDRSDAIGWRAASRSSHRPQPVPPCSSAPAPATPKRWRCSTPSSISRRVKRYNDPQYRSRRAGLTVITLACTTCDEACFCSSFGKGHRGEGWLRCNFLSGRRRLPGRSGHGKG